MRPLLTRTALSSRGDMQVDPRTNTLIIRDLAARLQTRRRSDQHARPGRSRRWRSRRGSSQTNRDFARDVGVQWGFNGRVASDLGNTTGLAFPNQGSLTGRTGPIQGPIQGEITDHAATAVNLGVSPATSAIGLALGSVNGAFNLDVALTALEATGQGRMLSTPRVSTQNNVEAEITQGVQIPIQTVANNTVDRHLQGCRADAQGHAADHGRQHGHHADHPRERVARLQPRHQRHPAHRHAARHHVGAGQRRADDRHRRASTSSQQQATQDRTPGLYRLPLLGWLFQRESDTDQNRELLIFITPRIIKS